MISYIIVGLICCFVLILGTVIMNKLNKKNEDEEDLKIVKRRKSIKSLQGLKVGESLALKFEKDANVSKKFKIESLCMQAGLPLSYGEYKLICLLCAIIIPIAIMIAINNPFLDLIMIFLVYFIPGQIIKILSNKRVKKMEEQCGSFLRIVLERYKTSKDMSYSIVNTLPDFRGCEPFYSNLRSCVSDINLGMPIEDALTNLAISCGNKFLARFSDYYKISSELATHESKHDLLYQAFLQYEENRELKLLLKKEISGPVSESYIMVVATPAFMVWQSLSNPDYLDFMLNTTTGKIGIAVIFLVVLGSIIFINAKIAAPLD